MSGWRETYLDTPVRPPCHPTDEWVTIQDPMHPLYGRTFRVAWRPSAGKGRFVMVFYGEEERLRIPSEALKPPNFGQVTGTKLSCASVTELVRCVDGWGITHEGGSALGKSVGTNASRDPHRSGQRTEGGAR